MQCPICWANTVGFIGTDCRCGPVPEPDPSPIEAVTVDGVPVTHDGVTVTNGGVDG